MDFKEDEFMRLILSIYVGHKFEIRIHKFEIRKINLCGEFYSSII